MATIAGDMREITCNHPVLGSFIFKPKGGEEFNVDLGGYKSADDTSLITGDGEMIDQIQNSRWAVEGPIANDTNTRKDQEKIAQLAAHPLPGDWTFAHSNGTIWGGTGKPVGDVTGNTGAGTLDIKISGGGVLKTQ